jgi:hypothetical protein
LELPERWKGDGPNSDGETRGELRDVESIIVVPEKMWEYREQTLSETYSLRADSLRRVIYLDAAVRYVADVGRQEEAEQEEGEEPTCDVWLEYADESEKPSLEGFISWMEVEDVGQLWLEVGFRMFFGEHKVMEVRDRALADTLSTLRYFRGL